MKKSKTLVLLLTMLLVVSLTLGLTACGNEGDGDKTAPEPVTKFVVSFDSAGGTSVQPIVVEKGKTITLPTAPTKVGYTFDGWYIDETITNAFANTTAINNDTILYAKWSAIACTITFDSKGGSDVASINGKYDDTVVKPADPTKIGYTFGGWYTDEACESAYPFGALKESVTVYAKWIVNTYTITYFKNDGTDAKTVLNQDYNTVINEPDALVRNGYTFGGWYVDKECTDAKKYTFGSKITANVNLYAKWTANTYKVTFDSGVEAISGEYNTVATKPADPTKIGYTFGGWYTIDGQVYTFDKFTENVKLYAKWTANTYKVTLKYNDLVTPDTVVDVIYDEAYPTLPDWTRTGYTFEGWFTAETAGEPIAPNGKYTYIQDMTIYAHWEANTYQVTLKYNDLVTSDTVVDVKYDEAYPTLPDWTRAGYTFEGWFTAETAGEPITSNGNYTYAKDMTIYAHWKANTYTIEFNSNDGNNITSTDVTYDQPFAFEVPTNTGYDFVGWYTIDENGYAYKLTDELGNGLKPWHIEWGIGKYANVKVWASWKETVHNVTCTQEQVNGVDAGLLLVNGGVNAFDVAFGKNYTIEATAKRGYEFIGWYIGNVEVTKEATYTTTMPNKSVNYVAKFALIPEFADFEFTSTLSSLTITKYNGSGTEVIIPEGTTIIGDGTNVVISQSIKNVVLPYGLKTISAHAFGDVLTPLSIEKINIPSTVKTIGDYAFAELYYITTITLPQGLVSLGAHAFDGCSGLTTVNISDLTSLNEIKPYTFYETSLNSDFTIPGNITKIGEYAFAGIGGQGFEPTITVTLKEGVKEIGDHAFDHSYDNGSIEISYYSNVKAIVLPKSLMTIYADSLHPGGADIYYNGTTTECVKLLQDNNIDDVGGVKPYCYSETSNTDGNHWHYDTDGSTPIIW